jgi:hypothetical protein
VTAEELAVDKAVVEAPEEDVGGLVQKQQHQNHHNVN